MRLLRAVRLPLSVFYSVLGNCNGFFKLRTCFHEFLRRLSTFS